MKRTLFLLMFTLALTAAAAQNLTVGSYNIRNDNSSDTRNGDGWAQRCPVICELVQWVDYDIFGAQEVKKNQLDDMLAQLSDYDHVGVGRDDGAEKGEFMAVYYLRDRFELLDSGTFWLSETPDKVSRGWDGACNRTVTWVELKDRKSGKEFFYFNTHLDHKGKAAREEGVKLLIEKIHEIAGKKAPAIVGGDFNTPVDSPIFKPLTKYMVSARAKAATTDHKGTFNGFGSAPDTIVIDHLYYRGKLKCQLFATLDGNYGAPYISDHYPIAMVFTL